MQCLNLVRFVGHLEVGRLQISEVLEGVVGHPVGDRLLQDHRLVEAVNAFDLHPGLDAREQSHGLAAAVTAADTQTRVEVVFELPERIECREAGKGSLQCALVEPSGGQRFQPGEVEIPFERCEGRGDIAADARARLDEVEAERRVAPTVVVDERPGQCAPDRFAITTAEHLIAQHI